MSQLGSAAAPYKIAKIQGQSESSLEVRQSIIDVSGSTNRDIVSSMNNTGINSKTYSKPLAKIKSLSTIDWYSNAPIS